ncbi:MAG: hypothetical protein WC587_01145 [Candidatus Paceibacterota bacterium]
MEDKQEYCERLFKEWENIKKRTRAYRITTKTEDKEQLSLSREEWKGLDVIKEKLKKECEDFLSPAEINKLER